MAAIPFLCTVVFQVGAVLLLSAILGVDGIWYSLIVAGLTVATVTIFFWITKRKKYGYWDKSLYSITTAKRPQIHHPELRDSFFLCILLLNGNLDVVVFEKELSKEFVLLAFINMDKNVYFVASFRFILDKN